MMYPLISGIFTELAVVSDRYIILKPHCEKCSLQTRGEGALRYRGGGGAHLRYVFRRRTGIFLRPLHVRDFVKEGYFFVPRYEVWGQNPLTIHETYAALTPSDSRSIWASEFAAAKHAEDYKILS